MIAIESEFCGPWSRFLCPLPGEDQWLAFRLRQEHLPYFARGTAVELTGVDLIAEGASGQDYEVELSVPGALATTEAMTPTEKFRGRQHMATSLFGAGQHVIGDWRFRIRRAGVADYRSLDPFELADVRLVVGFALAEFCLPVPLGSTGGAQSFHERRTEAAGPPERP